MSIKWVGFGVVAVVLVAALTACGQGQQQSSTASKQGQQQTGIAPSSVLPSQPVAPDSSVADATLMVQPASIDGCDPNQPIVATVSWHSRVPRVKVLVQGPEQGTPQLFSESGYTGNAKTGPWVVANTRFTLINSETGAVLAQRAIAEVPCK